MPDGNESEPPQPNSLRADQTPETQQQPPGQPANDSPSEPTVSQVRQGLQGTLDRLGQIDLQAITATKNINAIEEALATYDRVIAGVINYATEHPDVLDFNLPSSDPLTNAAAATLARLHQTAARILDVPIDRVRIALDEWRLSRGPAAQGDTDLGATAHFLGMIFPDIQRAVFDIDDDPTPASAPAENTSPEALDQPGSPPATQLPPSVVHWAEETPVILGAEPAPDGGDSHSDPSEPEGSGSSVLAFGKDAALQSPMNVITGGKKPEPDLDDLAAIAHDLKRKIEAIISNSDLNETQKVYALRDALQIVDQNPHLSLGFSTYSVDLDVLASLEGKPVSQSFDIGLKRTIPSGAPDAWGDKLFAGPVDDRGNLDLAVREMFPEYADRSVASTGTMASDSSASPRSVLGWADERPVVIGAEPGPGGASSGQRAEGTNSKKPRIMAATAAAAVIIMVSILVVAVLAGLGSGDGDGKKAQVTGSNTGASGSTAGLAPAQDAAQAQATSSPTASPTQTPTETPAAVPAVPQDGQSNAVQSSSAAEQPAPQDQEQPAAQQSAAPPVTTAMQFKQIVQSVSGSCASGPQVGQDLSPSQPSDVVVDTQAHTVKVGSSNSVPYDPSTGAASITYADSRTSNLVLHLAEDGSVTGLSGTSSFSPYAGCNAVLTTSAVPFAGSASPPPPAVQPPTPASEQVDQAAAVKEELADALQNAYVQAVRSADANYLLDHDSPYALDHYGAQRCDVHFHNVDPDPSFEIVVVGEIGGPAPWTWVYQGTTIGTNIPGVYSVPAELTQNDVTVDATIHAGWDGDLVVFSPC